MFLRDFLQLVLMLGIRLPHDGIGNVQWDGLRFATRVPDKFTPDGIPTKTNTFLGVLTLGTNGLPATASYPGQPDTETIFYEYGPGSKLLPTAFTEVQQGRGALVFRYEFLMLQLGQVDLEETGGYVPALVADANLQRLVTIWTNSRSYILIGNELVPDFSTRHPKRIGASVLGVLGTGVAIFLALGYNRWKKQNMTKKTNRPKG